jgi:hypothetical protein
VHQQFDVARWLIREPDVRSPSAYRQRVHLLALINWLLLLSVTAGLVLLVWKGPLFVTLAQRSNVETLTLAFFLVFFSYVGILAVPGALGGARVFWYSLRRRVQGAERVEQAKEAALSRVPRGPSVALNRALHRTDTPETPFELDVRDRVGSAGRLRVDGVHIVQLDAHGSGSNNLLAYLVEQVADVTGTDPADLEILHWQAVHEEELLKYVAQVDAIRALGRAVNASEVWPSVEITPAQCAELEERLSQICPALRDEAFLPHWEFQGEHKLPIIPEPLGIISLARSEQRVDPLSSLSAVLIVVIVAVFLLAFFVVRPPWVPGR